MSKLVQEVEECYIKNARSSAGKAKGGKIFETKEKYYMTKSSPMLSAADISSSERTPSINDQLSLTFLL